MLGSIEKRKIKTMFGHKKEVFSQKIKVSGMKCMKIPIIAPEKKPSTRACFCCLGRIVGIEPTHVARPGAAVCQTSAASVADFDSTDRALIASRFDDFEDVGIVLIAANREFNPFRRDGSFFIDAAPHRGFRSRRNNFRDRKKVFGEGAFQIGFGHFFEDAVFEFLNLGIEFDHGISPFADFLDVQ